ncbi:MAG: DUF3343 domain-containing protein [Syntrophaceae bacterium]|nr:DUF3343 domain-containing protein [Deltaproteobacteria bacterium]
MPFLAVLFDSVNAALLAEKLLKEEGVPFKLIPVPKSLSSDCGVCIRIDADDEARAVDALGKKVRIQAVRPLP